MNDKQTIDYADRIAKARATKQMITEHGENWQEYPIVVGVYNELVRQLKNRILARIALKNMIGENNGND